MDEFIGVVKLFAGDFAPVGWLPCNGQLLQISQYTAVFSLLGTTYGGDGVRTFALPDLRGRVPLGMGKGPVTNNYVQGEMSGSETVTLSINNMPAHSHTAQLQVSSGNATDAVATPNAAIATPGTLTTRTFTSTLGFNSTDPDVTLNAKSVAVASVGGNAPANVLQPYLALNYIICMNGIYPSRP